MKHNDQSSAEAKERAVTYSRVSSKEQVEGTSLDTQDKAEREFAARLGLELVRPYVDAGESAKTADRPEFQKALAFCLDKKNRIKYFIVYKLDRFARKQADHVAVSAMLRKAGVELLSVTEAIDSTPTGLAMEGMLSVFAELDNNIRTERTKTGMLERVREGVWVWPAPLGYYRPSIGSNITPHPDTAPLIRLAFEEYRKGTHTYRSLATVMSDRGLRTKSGKMPSAQLMEKILKNPVYHGHIRAWGGHEGVFEAIVDTELFDRCQSGFKGPGDHRIAKNTSFPLRGVKCHHCGSSITGSNSTSRSGQKYPYYHHHAYAKCSNSGSIPKDTMEQLFVEFLDEITPSDKYEKLFKAVVVDIWQNNYKQMDETARRTRREIDVLETERQKVFDLHRAGKYSDDEFEEQKRLVNQSIYAKRGLLQEQAVEEFNMEEALDYCFSFIRTTSQIWLEGDYECKQRLQNLVSKEKIEFDGQKFGTTKLSSLYQLNQDYSGNKSNLVALVGENWNQLIEEIKNYSTFSQGMRLPA